MRFVNAASMAASLFLRRGKVASYLMALSDYTLDNPTFLRLKVMPC